jgi:radical SAM superfamily enzyme YgiQ (UPF0313 family)
VPDAPVRVSPGRAGHAVAFRPEPATRVVLVSPYELGRQPFALAEPARWLADEGFDVRCVDLSLQRLEPETLAGAKLVAVHLGMHTATRIALAALPRIRELAPDAVLCAYGLYAPLNHDLLAGYGVAVILGGESEPALCETARAARSGRGVAGSTGPRIDLDRIEFRVPDRSGLPSLDHYAGLILPDGTRRRVGFVESTRGCKHLCRHCPVVPVYEGRFRVVPPEVVMADIRQQVAAGAEHLSFGDPDFLNGPGHALRVINALHAEFPALTFDVTINVEHLLRHAAMLPKLRDAGCLFIVSAVESVDDAVLEHLDKGHRGRDFDHAARIVAEAGIAFAPTFVAFTPWTTLDGYRALLDRLVELRLVESVPPVQLSIRLLVPQGSHLLRLPGFEALVDAFDPITLGYPWRHPDPRVDRLHAQVRTRVMQGEQAGEDRRTVFEAVWQLAHQAQGCVVPALPADLGAPIARLSEPWYCCAEPTDEQLASF